MKREAYLALVEKHREELEAFPIVYAFDEKRLEEGLKKLGTTKDECVSYLGIGDVMRKADVPAFEAMCERHHEELMRAMKDEEFAEAAFLYEMDNHEYAINWSGDADVLSCFQISMKKLREMGLEDAYRRARNAHMKHAQEWEMI